MAKDFLQSAKLKAAAVFRTGLAGIRIAKEAAQPLPNVVKSISFCQDWRGPPLRSSCSLLDQQMAIKLWFQRQSKRDGMVHWLRLIGSGTAVGIFMKSFAEEISDQVVHMVCQKPQIGANFFPEGYYLMCLPVLFKNGHELDQEIVSILYFPEMSCVMTVESSEALGSVWEPIAEMLEMENSLLREKCDLSLFLCMFADAAVDVTFPWMFSWSHSLQIAETLSYEDDAKSFKSDAVALRKKLRTVRTNLWEIREVLQEVSQNEFQLLSETSKTKIASVKAHCSNNVQVLEKVMIQCDALLQIYQGQLASKVDFAATLLTYVSLILAPQVLWTGFWSMNHEVNYMLSWRLGYLLFWIGVVLIAILTIFALKLRPKKVWSEAAAINSNYYVSSAMGHPTNTNAHRKSMIDEFANANGGRNSPSFDKTISINKMANSSLGKEEKELNVSIKPKRTRKATFHVTRGQSFLRPIANAEGGSAAASAGAGVMNMEEMSKFAQSIHEFMEQGDEDDEEKRKSHSASPSKPSDLDAVLEGLDEEEEEEDEDDEKSNAASRRKESSLLSPDKYHHSAASPFDSISSLTGGLVHSSNTAKAVVAAAAVGGVSPPARVVIPEDISTKSNPSSPHFQNDLPGGSMLASPMTRNRGKGNIDDLDKLENEILMGTTTSGQRIDEFFDAWQQQSDRQTTTATTNLIRVPSDGLDVEAAAALVMSSEEEEEQQQRNRKPAASPPVVADRDKSPPRWQLQDTKPDDKENNALSWQALSNLDNELQTLEHELQ